jgi:hypothetical protein
VINVKERYSFEKKYILAKAEDKGKVMLYTLLEVGTFNKTVAIGNKSEEAIPEMSEVLVKIDITLENHRLELKDGSTKFLDVANKFIDYVKVIDNK